MATSQTSRPVAKKAPRKSPVRSRPKRPSPVARKSAAPVARKNATPAHKAKVHAKLAVKAAASALANPPLSPAVRRQLTELKRKSAGIVSQLTKALSKKAAAVSSKAKNVARGK